MYRFIEYQLEYNVFGWLCCLVPLGVALFWLSLYLGIGAYRRFLDAHLVTMRLGLNEMPVSRRALGNPTAALHMMSQAIETTRRKPLDEVQTLTYAPRLSENNQTTDPGLDEATETLGAIMGGFAPQTNGNGSHDEYES